MMDIHEKFFKMVVKLHEQKDEIIISKLKEYGYEIDLELEKKSRFKSLICEKCEDLETWYYRDGTPDGLRVVTFEGVVEEEDFLNKPLNIEIKLNYY